MCDLISLGEVMIRLSPPRCERLRQAASLDMRVCGAQFNLAANLALLGKRAVFLSKLPANELGLFAKHAGLSYGVDMSHVTLTPDTRMGVVYVEFAGEPRTTGHVYDRRGSAASTISVSDFAWSEILATAQLAYTDGIFPGLSDSCRAATFEFVKNAKEQGCDVCFDVNYRESIWTPLEARQVYQEILPNVTVLATNRSVSEVVFGYRASDEDLLWRYRQDFGCQTVCLTSRETLGTRRGAWRSMALHEDKIICGRTFEFDVVDRFGTGDAFFAGFLYGYLGYDVEFALSFGNALCALAHTIEGDVIQVSVEEVTRLLDKGYNPHLKR